MAKISYNSLITPDKLTAGRVLARNTFFNILGQIIPVLVAIIAIPLLIKGLGKERFGVLAILWVIIGYFGLFDLGLGRALTQMVAEKLGTKEHQDIPNLLWTSLLMMFFLGLFGAGIIASCSSWLVCSALNIPAVLLSETRNSLYLIAVFLPIIISIPTLRGLLEAHQRFDITSIINTAAGIYFLLAPLLVLFFSYRLLPIVGSLIVGRCLVFGVYLVCCFKVVPTLRLGIRIKLNMLRSLWGFGAWMTASNILSPLMSYFDRFIIGALISMSAVAFYVTPYEAVTKLWLIPGALMGVLFPAFSSSFLTDRLRTARLFQQGVKYIFLALFPITLLLVTLAFEGLNLWLGEEFAQHSARVVQWLTAGILINSLAFVPFGLLQGAGRPDLTAKVHMLELPLYLLAIWFLLKAYGIEGVAIAWLLRVTLDAVILFFLVQRLLPIPLSAILYMSLAIVAALCLLISGSLLHGLALKGVFLLFSLTAFSLFSWIFILVAEERTELLRLMKIQRAI